jgi:type IV pilus assembly protein PilM
MNAFNPKQSFLGIDIGASSIKAVQLGEDNGRPRLMTYGYSETRVDLVKAETPEAQQAIASTIKSLIRQAKINTSQTVAALPSYTVFTSIISLPLMTRKELNSAVRWEAKKFVPMPIDDLVLDWKLLKDDQSAREEKTPKNLRVLITAAPKTLVQRYNSIFKAAGLEIVALDTEAFALERALIGTDPAPVMVVDIGSAATDIAILVDGIPIVNRSINVGGDAISEAISRNLSVDHDRAEQFKIDFGLSIGQDNDVHVPKTIEQTLNSIIGEIQFVINNLFRAQNMSPVERVILSGGSSFLLNLPVYLEKKLSIKTFIGDPWARVVYPVDLKPVLQEVGPRFSVAIGLAMREIVP